MEYVKLTDEVLEFAPKNKGSILNYNLNVGMLLADGYKPFVEVERPDTIRQYHIDYEETSAQIIEKIVYDETQEQAKERIKQEEEQKEQERKSKLKMTKRDFFLYVVKPYNVTYSALMTALQTNDTVYACYEGCNHIYRYDEMLVGNIKPMLEQLTGTTIDEDELNTLLDDVFENHNAENVENV